jgi:hypothetical protein
MEAVVSLTRKSQRTIFAVLQNCDLFCPFSLFSFLFLLVINIFFIPISLPNIQTGVNEIMGTMYVIRTSDYANRRMSVRTKKE